LIPGFLLISSLSLALICVAAWFRTGERIWAAIASVSALTVVNIYRSDYAPDEWRGLLLVLSGALLMLAFVFLWVVLRDRRFARSGP